MNPGKLKKILLFSVLALLSALLWYLNASWHICDRVLALKEADLMERVDTFPVERNVYIDVTHARMSLMSSLKWKLTLQSGEVIFNGTHEELRSKKIALPAPGEYGYAISVEGMDRAGKKRYWWCSDNACNLEETGVNYIHLLYTGDPHEKTAFTTENRPR